METVKTINEYCPKCERETKHEIIDDDELFECGLLCLVCRMVWEASPKLLKGEEDGEEDREEDGDCGKV